MLLLVTLATAYRALTVTQAQMLVLLPSTLLPYFFCWAAGSWTTGYLISVRSFCCHCCLLLLGGVVDYGLPHLCTSAYRALTVAQAQIVLLPNTLLPSTGRGRGLAGYLISVRSMYVCLPPHLSLRLNFQRYSVHSLVLRRELCRPISTAIPAEYNA